MGGDLTQLLEPLDCMPHRPRPERPRRRRPKNADRGPRLRIPPLVWTRAVKPIIARRPDRRGGRPPHRAGSGGRCREARPQPDALAETLVKKIEADGSQHLDERRVTDRGTLNSLPRWPWERANAL